MPKYTQRQLLAEGLKALGAKIDPAARSTKYETWMTTDATPLWLGGSTQSLYVGRGGALRRGRTVSESHSCGDGFRNRVIDAGRMALGVDADGKSRAAFDVVGTGQGGA